MNVRFFITLCGIISSLYGTSLAVTFDIDADTGVSGIQSSINVAPGDYFDVDIFLSNLGGPEIIAAQFGLSFDPSLFFISSVALNNALFDTSFSETLSNPSGSYAAVGISSSGIASSSILLATVSFDTLSSGVGVIKFRNPAAANTSFVTIPLDGANGASVAVGEVPTPPAFLAIVTALSLICIVGRRNRVAAAT